MREEPVIARDPAHLARVIGDRRTQRLMDGLAETSRRLAGRAVINVNSTSVGGGVADMLRTMLGYASHAGIETRWLVVEGDSEFFAVTKDCTRTSTGCPETVGRSETKRTRHYRAALSANADDFVRAIRPGDVVVLHDPRRPGSPPLRARGARR